MSNPHPVGRKTHRHNDAFFNPPTVENCYWAGFIAADGSIDHRNRCVSLVLAEKDREHLVQFAQCTGFTGPLVPQPKVKAVQLSVYSAEQWQYDLENVFNVVPAKSLSLKPPYELERWGVQYVRAYIVGYLDGDGCIRTDRRDGCLSIDVFSGSLRLVRWVKSWLEAEFHLPDQRIYTYNPRNHTYRLRGSSARAVLLGLRGTYKHQLQRKWYPVEHQRQLRPRHKCWWCRTYSEAKDSVRLDEKFWACRDDETCRARYSHRMGGLEAISAVLGRRKKQLTTSSATGYEPTNRRSTMKRAKHPDPSTHTGALSKPVQVNFTEGQKSLLVLSAFNLGVPLAVYVRMAALTQSDAVKAAVVEAKRALR